MKVKSKAPTVDFARDTTSGTAISQGMYRGTSVKQYGRHGDINPGNILWFDDEDISQERLKGTLKIADFGQAELNSLQSRTKPRDVANTLTYRPPECDKLDDQAPAPIRQTYDIWCLGCVYLEFITWFFGGHGLLRSFARQRMTPDYFQNNMRTDTFFQVDRDTSEDCLRTTIKTAVVEVCSIHDDTGSLLISI